MTQNQNQPALRPVSKVGFLPEWALGLVNEQVVAFPTSLMQGLRSAGSSVTKSFVRRTVRRLSEKCCAPILAPGAHSENQFNQVESHYGEWLFASQAASEVFSFDILNLQSATFTVVPILGPPPTINSTIVTPGSPFTIITLDLDTTPMDGPGRAYVVIENECGCSTAVLVEIQQPA